MLLLNKYDPPAGLQLCLGLLPLLDNVRQVLVQGLHVVLRAGQPFLKSLGNTGCASSCPNVQYR